MVAGGFDGSRFLLSVISLLPLAATWTHLEPLPPGTGKYGLAAGIVGGRLQLAAQSEVIERF